MKNEEMLPLPAFRIAFVNILYDTLRVASPKCIRNSELLLLLVCRITFVNILYDKLMVASPTCLYEELRVASLPAF